MPASSAAMGLAEAISAEKDRPRCDVFWNNEEMRTRQLEAAGVLRQTNAFTAFGYRTRRLVVNTNFLKLAHAPATLAGLTNKALLGKVALAYPLFGTTSTHFLALRQAWGQERWLAWCRALQANKPFVVDGNSVVVNMVGKGEAWVGLTDFDDVLAGQEDKLPVDSILLKDDGFVIRNTVAVTAGAPHPRAAQQLLECLASADIVSALKDTGALEGSTPDPSAGIGKPVDWPQLLKSQEAAVNDLKTIFLR